MASAAIVINISAVAVNGGVIMFRGRFPTGTNISITDSSFTVTTSSPTLQAYDVSPVSASLQKTVLFVDFQLVSVSIFTFAKIVVAGITTCFQIDVSTPTFCTAKFSSLHFTVSKN